MNYLKDNNNTFFINNYFSCFLVESSNLDHSHEEHQYAMH